MNHIFHDFKSYYKITLYPDDMFLRQRPPSSSGKVHFVGWNTADIKHRLSRYALAVKSTSEVDFTANARQDSVLATTAVFQVTR
jgi:hypothetical protein